MSLPRTMVLGMVLASSTALAVEPPWGTEKNLKQRMILESTHLCTDGKGHYVALTEDTPESDSHLFYGDGQQFLAVPPVRHHEGTFFEPRFVSADANPNHMGVDWRVHSKLEVPRDAKECRLRCGDRTNAWTLVEPEKAREQLRKATFEPGPMKFMPYALLRDDRGTYYLVEQGFPASDDKRFRIFIGPRGQVKPQKMLNVVKDSQGEIFTTKGGDLRLVVNRNEPSFWIAKKQKKKLNPVPVGDNLPFIYNELGVYTGARLGTPCDDV